MRFHRRVRHVAVEVGCFDDRRGGFLSLRQVAAGAGILRRGRGLEQVVEDVLVVDARLRPVELRLHQGQRLIREIGPFVQHGDHSAVPDYTRPGLFGGACVGVLQLRAVRRRTHQAGVQHAGKHEVAGVLRLAGDFVERVLARRRMTDNRVRGHRFDRHVLHVALNALSLHQLPVGHALAGRVGICHYASLHVQPGGGRLQLLARHLQKDGFRLGARAAQRRTEIAHVHRTERAHVVGAQFGVAENHVHRVVRHVEFFGEDLCQHGHRALPKFHLSGKAGHPPIGSDPQVGVEVRRVALPGRQARGFLRGERTDAETEEQAGTGHGQQFAAAQAGSSGFRAIGRFHSAPPLRRAGGVLNGFQDSNVRAAAAQIVFHVARDLFRRRFGRLEQQRVGVEDHPRRAVSALERVVLHEGRLYGVKPGLPEPFDGHHVLAGDVLHRHRAGAHRLLVHNHGAGSAQAFAAAELGTCQCQVRAQHP